MGLGLRGNVFQELEKIFLKFFPQKAIKQRVQAVVKISYADSDGHGSVHNVRDFTVADDTQLNQDIQKSEYLVGNPGKEKEKHNRHNYPKDVVISWLVLLDFISLLQGFPNESIAGEDDQKGEQEAQNVLSQAQPDGEG